MAAFQRSSAARWGLLARGGAGQDFVSPLGEVEEFLANFATAEVLDKRGMVFKSFELCTDAS